MIAGVAGLLAGGFSMAVGEYVSVRSQRELLDYQIDLQRHQLHHTPEQERDILREIYEAKGLSRAEADLIVRRIMKDPERAIDTFVREEIGLSAETMGSPVAAGLGSLCAFALGALVPLLPFLILGGGQAAFALSIAASGHRSLRRRHGGQPPDSSPGDMDRHPAGRPGRPGGGRHLRHRVAAGNRRPLKAPWSQPTDLASPACRRD